MQVPRILVCLIVASILQSTSHAADKQKPTLKKPVLAVPNQKLPVVTAEGKGYLHFYAEIRGTSVDLTRVYPAVTRAVVVIHGSSRNAKGADNAAQWAIHDSGEKNWNMLLIAPEFLEEIDAAVNQLPEDDLRWKHGAWQDGENARNVPVSSFDALDAILERISNHILLPNLQSVALVGIAGGGLMVQRYAVVGRGGDALIHSGIHLRYVIVQPSTYLYFSPERPVLDAYGGLDFAVPPRECSSDNNRWRYGIDDPPPYAANADFAALEQRYIHRNVVYLLGTEAVDPNEPGVDTGCAAENQGTNRFFRGKAYFRYLELRHPELATESASQQLWFVPGVENDSRKMLTSTCGTAALLDVGTCITRILEPKP
jgi:hypothetical protein